jgi:magnesium-transporting ATPase (P-type)
VKKCIAIKFKKNVFEIFMFFYVSFCSFFSFQKQKEGEICTIVLLQKIILLSFFLFFHFLERSFLICFLKGKKREQKEKKKTKKKKWFKKQKCFSIFVQKFLRSVFKGFKNSNLFSCAFCAQSASVLYFIFLKKQ